ncbi:hypothetical protein COU56_02840 [Candidatus Pacearchaeota archaeon CG10_big_fil_rev_8_21_14_0_10_31_9]|nr:MAG: hypothetical protein AUJ62_01100 [Candidatus Pacearchaeota archaeon CG1_02_32_21]PIN94207.1 MAG: hypothetical protein COU56_02840 [Candidatus Pacearchaeota archaeon CG10_big_fil_rev_8_21_14_0_10_31_9]PIZ82540.1 MAG: hypothetical protein COX97_04270 [Candidatus Pacearchaeota archaeon CG_4_10_14_0_2_um_filter_05_32_18]
MKIGKTLGLAGITLGALAPGCETMPQGQSLTPQGQAFGEFLVYQGVGSYISGQLDPKGTNVNVNNGSGGNTQGGRWETRYVKTSSGEIYEERVYIQGGNGMLEPGQGRIINN